MAEQTLRKSERDDGIPDVAALPSTERGSQAVSRNKYGLQLLQHGESRCSLDSGENTGRKTPNSPWIKLDLVIASPLDAEFISDYRNCIVSMPDGRSEGSISEGTASQTSSNAHHEITCVLMPRRSNLQSPNVATREPLDPNSRRNPGKSKSSTSWDSTQNWTDSEKKAHTRRQASLPNLPIAPPPERPPTPCVRDNRQMSGMELGPRRVTNLSPVMESGRCRDSRAEWLPGLEKPRAVMSQRQAKARPGTRKAARGPSKLSIVQIAQRNPSVKRSESCARSDSRAQHPRRRSSVRTSKTKPKEPVRTAVAIPDRGSSSPVSSLSSQRTLCNASSAYSSNASIQNLTRPTPGAPRVTRASPTPGHDIYTEKSRDPQTVSTSTCPAPASTTIRTPRRFPFRLRHRSNGNSSNDHNVPPPATNNKVSQHSYHRLSKRDAGINRVEPVPTDDGARRPSKQMNDDGETKIAIAQMRQNIVAGFQIHDGAERGGLNSESIYSRNTFYEMSSHHTGSSNGVANTGRTCVSCTKGPGSFDDMSRKTPRSAETLGVQGWMPNAKGFQREVSPLASAVQTVHSRGSGRGSRTPISANLPFVSSSSSSRKNLASRHRVPLDGAATNATPATACRVHPTKTIANPYGHAIEVRPSDPVRPLATIPSLRDTPPSASPHLRSASRQTHRSQYTNSARCGPVLNAVSPPLSASKTLAAQQPARPTPFRPSTRAPPLNLSKELPLEPPRQHSLRSTFFKRPRRTSTQRPQQNPPLDPPGALAHQASHTTAPEKKIPRDSSTTSSPYSHPYAGLTSRHSQLDLGVYPRERERERERERGQALPDRRTEEEVCWPWGLTRKHSTLMHRPAFSGSPGGVGGFEDVQREYARGADVPRYRVLHSYNSPAYKNMPIWG
ncbi:hypothetical protein E4U39_003356 [Claviceps sp. Clav50 group G5]|nr:hypothetical protein E4U39_003356 [Claviceps sp. Clav50 group G5]